MTAARLAQWLSGWDDAALTALLDRRPDVVLGRPPATLGQLAERLDHRDLVMAALRGLDAPALQVLEALQALGERRTRAALLELLEGEPGPEHERAVDGVLADLTATALVWPGAGGRLEVPSGLHDVFPAPLGLGPPARTVWAEHYVDALDRAVRGLGGRPEGRKADKLELLLGLLADPQRIRSRIAGALPEVAEGLRRLAWAGADDDDAVGYYSFDAVDLEGYRSKREAERWGVEYGLLAGAPWGGGATMPAEVALALRGADYRAPFSPQPPPVTTRTVAPETVASAAAAATSSLLAAALTLLDRLARVPVPVLAAGGVGVRELGRLGKELGLAEPQVRLLLALAAATELLDRTTDRIGTGARFPEWRRAEPAAQAAILIEAWWTFPTVPTRSRDADGKALPVLQGSEPCTGCQAARGVMLHVTAAQPPGTSADSRELARLARWHRPMVHVLPQDAGAPLATVWQEAELLGVVAAGAVSPVGRALLADDWDAVEAHLHRLLPEARDTALFGSDLTALVTGTPSARVSELLDSCADRESSGGGVTWRFSPASVRRALDGGTTAEALARQLSGIAERELPQPLTYLIGDVGRRHGRLRLLPAASLIRSDDEALLAEVAADRRLAGLGLRVVAPTVLACAVPFEQALGRLRELGYFPVAEPSVASAGKESRPGKSAPRPAPVRRPEPPVPPSVEPHLIAERLLSAGEVGVPAFTGVASVLARQAPGLASDEIDLLAAAVEEGGQVRIEYRAASGAVTRRVIQDPDLDEGMLYAWCELRQDERMFSVSRILAVSPVKIP